MSYKTKLNAETFEKVFEKKNGISFKQFEDDTREYPLSEAKDVAEMIEDAVKKGIKITVIGDYDVDGEAGASIFGLTLEEMGANYSIRIPQRIKEGFGVSKSIIDEIDEGIILTVDNGIAAIEAVQYAKDKGLTVIITDHHTPITDENGNHILPNADYILDPHLHHSEFEDYCGAGVAKKVCDHLASDELKKKLLSLAMIATIADVVPLVKENRYIVREGLKNINNMEYQTLGLHSLLTELKVDQYMEEDDIGYKIGPTINAIGRLLNDGSQYPYKLLMEENDVLYAKSWARNLVSYNKIRKEKTEELLDLAETYILENGIINDCPIIIYLPKAPEGLIGLISGRIAEKYKVPTLTFTDSETPNVIKASGRSNGDIDIFKMLNKKKDMFLKFGGHPDACGLSMNKDKLEDLRIALINENISYIRPNHDADYDIEIEAEDIPFCFKELQKYKPFGNKNPSFVFKIKNFNLIPNGTSYYNIKGDDKNTIEFFGNNDIKAVNFKLANRYLLDNCPKKMNLIGTINNNYFFSDYSKKMVFSTQVIFSEYEIVNEERPKSLLQMKLLEKAKQKNE